LHGAVARALQLLWPQDSQQHPQMTPTAAGGEVILDKIQELLVKNGTQRLLQSQSVSAVLKGITPHPGQSVPYSL